MNCLVLFLLLAVGLLAEGSIVVSVQVVVKKNESAGGEVDGKKIHDDLQRKINEGTLVTKDAKNKTVVVKKKDVGVQHIVEYSRKDTIHEVPAQQNDGATLLWTTLYSGDECYWLHGTTLLSSGASPTASSSNYSVVSSPDSCQLTIKRVRVADAGIWTSVVPGNPEQRFRLNVLVPPSSPTLTWNGPTGPTGVVKVGKNGTFEVRCSTKQGFPQPDAILWLLDGHPVDPQPSMNITSDSNGLVSAASTLDLQDHPNGAHNVTCAVQHKALTKTATVTRRLGRWSPVTWVNITHPDHDLFIGEGQTELTLVCESDGFPLTGWNSRQYYWKNPETLKDLATRLSGKARFSVRATGQYWCGFREEMESKQTVVLSEKITVHADAVPGNKFSTAVNSSLSLTCQVATGGRFCAWTHHGITISKHPLDALRYNGEKNDRYRIEGDPATGSCNVVLKSVIRSDGGTWICLIPGQHSQVYHVTVTDE